MKAYAAAMKELADNPEERKKYGDNAGKRVRELFLYSEFKNNIRKVLL